MPLIALAILFVLLVLALIPISIVQRFRAGTSRRPARKWVATLNLVLVGASAGLFLIGAGISNVWVAEAFLYTLAGLCGGAVLGGIGVALTRWQHVGGRWHYTPNRWLVLAITAIVAARIVYGFWQSWTAWDGGLTLASAVSSRIAPSLGAGAVVLGYYLLFWAGVRWRIGRRQSRALASQ